MIKFPLTKRLGLKIEHKIVPSYDQTGKQEVFSIDAAELEAILQAATKIYFQRTDVGYVHLREDKKSSHNFVGLLIAETPVKPDCVNHEPEYEGELVPCKHCETPLKRRSIYEP